MGQSSHTAVLLQGSVYVGGGFEGRSTEDAKDCYRLEVYNLTTNQWSTSPITTPYCWFAMTVLDDKLIIAGGETKSDEVTNKVLVLDRGQWKDFNEMPTARECATAAGYQSLLIVIGGLTKLGGKWTRLATTELLDTTNGCWYTCDDLPVPHQSLKIAVVYDTLYLLGGSVAGPKPSPQVFTASLDNLSSRQLKWKSVPDTPWCYSTPVVLYNKFLQTSEVCAFNPSTGLWKQIINIPEPMNYTGVVGMDDNSIMVLGGVTRQAEYSRSVWIGILE